MQLLSMMWSMKTMVCLSECMKVRAGMDDVGERRKHMSECVGECVIECKGCLCSR